MSVPKRGLALVVAAALHGCGGSDDGADTDTRPKGTVGGDQRGVLETIDALQTASRRGDGRKICAEVFTRELARSIETASTTSCSGEVRKRLFQPNQSFSVRRAIEVDGNTAKAVIREQNGDVSTLHMLKRGGRWQINRVEPRETP